MAASLACHEKFGPGGPKLAAKIGLSLPKTVHLRVHAGFTSIVEAIGFPNRCHQQSVVSEREQQESDVLKKAYTHGREQQKNR